MRKAQSEKLKAANLKTADGLPGHIAADLRLADLSFADLSFSRFELSPEVEIDP
jgi:uncharacterized protein YjbI with pentapeptide repeats